jgi:hypothetical protein
MNSNRINTPNRGNTKSVGLLTVSENILYALEFFNTEQGLYRTKSPITCPPDIIVKGNYVYFSFQTCYDETSEKIKNIFTNLSRGSFFTITDGLYRDASLGIDDISFANTYEFLEYNENLNLIKATKPASLTISDKIEKYGQTNFIIKPQIEVATLQSSTPLYGVINYFGSKAENSFRSLGVLNGDYVEFIGTGSNDSIAFKIRKRYNDDENREILIFDEGKTQAETLLNSPTYVKGLIERLAAKDPPLQPDPELFPVPSDDGLGLNRCPSCTGRCWNCLIEAIRRAESWVFDQPNDGCNAPQTGCDHGSGCDCGPFQIDSGDYINDICGPGGPCSNPDGHGGGTGYDTTCCHLCQAGYANLLCQTCPTTQFPDITRCCQEKVIRSQWLMRCYMRRYNRNPPDGCKCSGTVIHEYPLGGDRGSETLNCCTCEDIARRHNGGPSGPCKKSTDKYWNDPDKVKYWMDRLCPGCTDIEDTNDGNQPPYDIPLNYETELINSMFTDETLPIEDRNVLDDQAPVVDSQPKPIKVGPYTINGNYPLYTTPEAAVAASPKPTTIRRGETTRGYHIMKISGVKYYMPNGLVMNITQFHGNYKSPSTTSSSTTSSSTTSSSTTSSSTTSSSTPPSSSSSNSGY